MRTNLERARFFALLLMAAVLGSICGCSASAGVPTKAGTVKEKPPVPKGGMLLLGAGATFPSALYDKWFKVYENRHPKIVVSYDSVGSGEGIRRFIGQDVKEEERVDFGASDAAMRDDEMARVPGGSVLLPVTAGSVALAYNLPAIPADLKLSREAYAGIFMGQIKVSKPHHHHGRSPGRERHNLRFHQAPGCDQQRMALSVRPSHPGELAGKLDARHG